MPGMFSGLGQSSGLTGIWHHWNICVCPQGSPFLTHILEESSSSLTLPGQGGEHPELIQRVADPPQLEEGKHILPFCARFHS